eukprot:g5565.t1
MPTSPTTWTAEETTELKIDYTDLDSYNPAVTKYNPTPGIFFVRQQFHSLNVLHAATGSTGVFQVPPNNYPFYNAEEKYSPIMQADGGQLSEWEPMYNPSADQAEKDREAAFEKGIPHGFVAPGDKYKDLPQIELTVVSELHNNSEYGKERDSDGKHSGGPFTIRGSYLFYFQQSSSKDPEGLIPLEYAMVEASEESKELDSLRYTILIQLNRAYEECCICMTYKLSSSKREIQETWLSALTRAILPLRVLVRELHSCGKMGDLIANQEKMQKSWKSKVSFFKPGKLLDEMEDKTLEKYEQNDPDKPDPLNTITAHSSYAKKDSFEHTEEATIGQSGSIEHDGLQSIIDRRFSRTSSIGTTSQSAVSLSRILPQSSTTTDEKIPAVYEQVPEHRNELLDRPMRTGEDHQRKPRVTIRDTVPDANISVQGHSPAESFENSINQQRPSAYFSSQSEPLYWSGDCRDSGFESRSPVVHSPQAVNENFIPVDHSHRRRSTRVQGTPPPREASPDFEEAAPIEDDYMDEISVASFHVTPHKEQHSSEHGRRISRRDQTVVPNQGSTYFPGFNSSTGINKQQRQSRVEERLVLKPNLALSRSRTDEQHPLSVDAKGVQLQKRQTVHSHLSPSWKQSVHSYVANGATRFRPYVPLSILSNLDQGSTPSKDVHQYFDNAIYEKQISAKVPSVTKETLAQDLCFEDELQEKLRQRRARIEARKSNIIEHI